MRRIVCAWLNRLPTDRYRNRAGSAGWPPDAPFALTASGAKGVRLTAVDDRAAALGLRSGASLADARTLVPGLVTREAEPDRDAAALLKLARWAGRYTPLTAPCPPDALWLDIAGCAHLFGGEEELLTDLSARLDRFGFSTRLALAPTPGAAWALAHYGPDRTILTGDLREALRPLPLAALRLDDPLPDRLAALGLRQIGDLYAIPSAQIARRFGLPLVERLDAALGLRGEPIAPLTPVAPDHVRIQLPEPALMSDELLARLAALDRRLGQQLESRGRGAKVLEATLYRVDGEAITLRIGFRRPQRASPLTRRLFSEKLERLEISYGIETIILCARETAPLTPRQLGGDAADTDALETLIDRLANRIGPRDVFRLAPFESHIPERAEVRNGSETEFAPWPAYRNGARTRRPLRLLDPPERIEVVAEVPEGPPRLFRWRKVAVQVVDSEGPERISPEWWRADHRRDVRLRDYYRVADAAGHRFWLYRDGAYAETDILGPPAWYLHGVFS